ncbi:outer membrane protein assembly factor BamB family protein [Nocardiopsis listeri]|uniref:outer membrane protein assembly factor BamB family protein n=1 Tax=Nocardiopsis listeri TaxID=53440 RepID=UPI00083035DC|nr:PQQ-binding-like beta-propeller repeat protein [Nocardiopsis listeri]
MARERRTESVLAWVGVGTVAGALLLAVLTVIMRWTGGSDQGEGLFEDLGWGWFWACLIGGIALWRRVHWKREAPDPTRGWDYVTGMGIAAAVVWLIAGDVLADGWHRMGVVVCALAIGLLLMLTVVRRPFLEPRSRSLTAFGTGALVVLLVGAVLPVLVEEDHSDLRHVVAEDPPEAAPVPERVAEVGWNWEPEGDAKIERVLRGEHGPLAVFADGVVSLNGIDGSEVWSYRRPARETVDVRTAYGRVYVTRDSGVTEVLDRASGESLVEYTGVPNADSEGDVGRVIGWSGAVRVHDDQRDGEPGMSAWDAESGEELWFRRSAPEEGIVCEGGSPNVRRDTVVYAVACVGEDDFAASDSGLLNLDAAKRVVFRVVSVDLRTGEELWSHEREEREEMFVPYHPWIGSAQGDGEKVLVVGEYLSAVPALLLDPETGEELLHLTEERSEGEEGLSAEFVLDADADGATVIYRGDSVEAEIHHVDTEGNLTEVVEAGGVHVDRHLETFAMLPDQVLAFNSHYSAYEERAQVLVVSPGERFGEGLDNRIALEGREPVEQLVATPGGVTVLMSEFSDGHLEGLVP